MKDGIQVITTAKEVMFLSLFVCLLATLCKNFPTYLHEIFREGLQWTSEKKWLNFGGDPVQGSRPGLLLLLLLKMYWLEWRFTQKCCRGTLYATVYVVKNCTLAQLLKFWSWYRHQKSTAWKMMCIMLFPCFSTTAAHYFCFINFGSVPL